MKTWPSELNLGLPNCRISCSGRPFRFELWGARGDLAFYCLRLAASLGSKKSKEQHKRHRVYIGSGHHCGVIPYSSVWCGGLPLGLMMNNTREEQPREGCSCGGDASWEGLDPDPFLLWWLALFIERGPWPSSQILSGKGANNWPF